MSSQDEEQTNFASTSSKNTIPAPGEDGNWYITIETAASLMEALLCGALPSIGKDRLVWSYLYDGLLDALRRGGAPGDDWIKLGDIARRIALGKKVTGKLDLRGMQ